MDPKTGQITWSSSGDPEALQETKAMKPLLSTVSCSLCPICFHEDETRGG